MTIDQFNKSLTEATKETVAYAQSAMTEWMSTNTRKAIVEKTTGEEKSPEHLTTKTGRARGENCRPNTVR